MILDEDLPAEAREILAKKMGVMVAVPNLGAMISVPLTMWMINLSYRTIDAECPYFFKLHLPNDLTPIEYARNMCVKEFLKDPFFKKLYFIDADMIPPANALDLLMFDDPLVSGQTYIWQSEGPNKDGFYEPPKMKINAFDFRPQTEDFISKLPFPDNRTFYCDAAGSACMVIRRSVLEEMPEPWYRTKRDPYAETLRSEDLDFCQRSGHKVLYVSKVQFGHIKTVDLRQCVSYGLNNMRGIIDRVKAAKPDELMEIVKALPNITFANEKPKEPMTAPLDFKVVEGGKR